MKKIKILEIIDQPFMGGGQINLLSLAESLSRMGFEVLVCSRDDGPLIDELTKSGIKHIPAAISKKPNKKVLADLKRIISDNRYDIVHTHGGVAGLYGRWAARKSGTSVIVHTLHGIHYLHYRNIFLRYAYILLEKVFSRFTQAIIYVSEADRKKGEKLGLSHVNRSFLVKNGIDVPAVASQEVPKEQIIQMREKLGLDSASPLIGTVARLHRQKGITYLIRSAAILRDRFPKVKFLIVGGGPLEKKTQDLIESLGLNDCVVLMGERTDALSILSLFDVFVLSSLWEGLPYVLMEAGAMRKPVVATNIDGVNEIIRNEETGLLVPSKDPERLAEAVTRMVEKPEEAKKFGENLFHVIKKEFTLSAMIENTKRIYLDSLEGVE